MKKIDKFELITLTERTEQLEETSKLLSDKLREYNLSKIGIYPKKESIAFVYYDDAGNLIAGLYGYICINSFFYIDILWIDEAFRYKGFGTSLLKVAEKWAREKNVLYMKTNSGTFQAPDFYLKHGYEVAVKLPLKIEGLSDQYDYLLIKYL